MRRTGRVLVGVIALALLVPEATLAGPRDRGPLKPGVVALGFSPVQILTSYNRWVIGTPAAQNPMLGNRCEPSPLSQRIWFAPPSSDPIICTVPKGAYLVISVVWFECSNLEPPPFYGNDEASLRLCLDAFAAAIVGASFTADGVRTGDLRPWTVTSALDALPAPNLFGTSAGITMARAYVMIIPPPRLGSHTYEAAGELLFAPYFLSTIYQITAG